MKIVKPTNEKKIQDKSKPISHIFSAEYARNLRLEFIAAHNERIRRKELKASKNEDSQKHR